MPCAVRRAKDVPWLPSRSPRRRIPVRARFVRCHRPSVIGPAAARRAQRHAPPRHADATGGARANSTESAEEEARQAGKRAGRGTGTGTSATVLTSSLCEHIFRPLWNQFARRNQSFFFTLLFPPQAGKFVLPMVNACIQCFSPYVPRRGGTGRGAGGARAGERQDGPYRAAGAFWPRLRCCLQSGLLWCRMQSCLRVGLSWRLLRAPVQRLRVPSLQGAPCNPRAPSRGGAPV